ncbi:MAG: HD domain-containing protein [Desulfosarcinaceae bacterium]|nr:HD domain-containing protein [Desulfosarcinaceae bacterium]
MLNDTQKLESLTRLGIELNQVHDLDILMERILTEARQFVNADAGSIYIRDGEQLHFTYTQNQTLQRRLPKGQKLIYSTFSMPVDKHSIAGYVAATGESLNINDVYLLDPTLPYQFGKGFDDASGYKTESVLTVPLKNAASEVLGILQIINAQDSEHHIQPFSATDETIMFHFASIAAVALERAQMTRAMILRMIRMAEMRDPLETGAHVNRVAGFAVEIYEQWAQRRNIDAKQIDKVRDILRMAAMLHDVGKIATSDLILKKPERLDKKEFSIMQLHTLHGAQLFLDRQSDFDEAAGIVALNHHERWDGSGYPGHIDVHTGTPLPGRAGPDGRPLGKKGEEIPLFGRIVSLADVYDALCSNRSYKEPWSEERIFDYLERENGKRFDPELVEIFFSRLDVIRAIQARYTTASEPVEPAVAPPAQTLKWFDAAPL